MKSCSLCGSYAINPSNHDRVVGKDLDLCDVCYWRTRAKKLAALLIPLMDSIEAYEAEKRPEDQWDEYDYMMLPRWISARRFLDGQDHV
jgi:hypothetical protein